LKRREKENAEKKNSKELSLLLSAKHIRKNVFS
jgi:hypothetical protein